MKKLLFDKDAYIAAEMNNKEIDWNIPSEYPDLTGYKQIAIDLETCDPNLMTKGPGWARNDGFVVGIAVAAGDYYGYFPIRHENGHNLDPKMTFKWLNKQMSTPHIDKIMHNATYDAGWLRAEGVEVQGRIIDTMVAAPIINENRFSYSLNNLGRDYIDMRKDEKLLRAAANEWGFDPKKDMWKMPPKYVGAYAEQDAVMTLKLWERLRIDIDKEELWSIFNLETSLIPLMLDMRTKGVRVDIDAADRAKIMLNKKTKALRAHLKRTTGVDVDPWASASVAKMFDALNLTYPKTEAGAPSFTKQYLNAHPHEACQSLVKLREFDKANSTFIDTILNHQHKGRIHCEFHQLRSDDGGTVTGRFSSSNPNLQQMPARDPDIKKLIRGLFLPEEGEKWGSFDYSSQEPRLLVHFAASMPHRDSIVDKIVDEYNTGDVDLHQMVADLAGIKRKEAKAVNLGIMYGMGVGKLATQLDISNEEAKELMQAHREKVPFVKQLAELASQRGGANGQIRTILGRKCRFHLWEPSTFGYNKPLPFEEANKEYGGMGRLRRAFTYKALNKLIQGSAADQTKKAMVDCYAEGFVPMLTVHDELCFSIRDQEQALRIKEIMETGLPLKVPSKVDMELGDNWGEVG
jgi:DNA polymerase I-like protein with 3'-5' exonuclease and polymerase domains